MNPSDPGAAPTPPSTGSVIGMRVLVLAASVLSCGLLSWVPMLRLAIVGRRLRDWWLLWISVLWVMVAVYVIATHADDDPASDKAMFMLLGSAAATSIYYLAVDSLLHQARVRGLAAGHNPPPHGPYNPMGGPPPYAGQGQGLYSPYGSTPTVNPSPTAPVAPVAPAPAPAPLGGQPPRIDRVRAELDELSDFLRSESGAGGAGGTGGQDDAWGDSRPAQSRPDPRSVHRDTPEEGGR